MWPTVTFESYPWERDPDYLALIPKSRKRKILPTYKAALPPAIADLPVSVSQRLYRRIEEVENVVVRFDQMQAARGYNLPALILRSESSSSSQIENLTSSVRNVALAELTEKTPNNARLIANNVAAMRRALGQGGPITIDSICAIHDVLMGGVGDDLAIRSEQVWIGGNSYSPHGASFVPPRASRVPECLRDLMEFADRDDISPVAKAAIFHAQFETIHPFTDGNGRTGRAILHRMLAEDEILLHSTLPISAGLLHDIGTYMGALDSYHEGNIEPIIECITDALELSCVIGGRMVQDIDHVLEVWSTKNTDRRGSASRRLAALLVEHPVVNVRLVASELGTSERSAHTLITTACERGILEKMGNAHRGVFYQASDLITVLEEASSVQGIRRMASR